MRTRTLLLIGLIVLGAVLLAARPFTDSQSKAAAAPSDPLSVNIFASPVQAGCYIAGPNDCRIHVDPFTINISSGSKLVFFSLVAIQQGSGIQRTIYNFKTDLSNPAPSSGTTYTPSLVTQDYSATCGKAYALSLQGQDSLDAAAYNLGLTGYFTCPAIAP